MLDGHHRREGRLARGEETRVQKPRGSVFPRRGTSVGARGGVSQRRRTTNPPRVRRRHHARGSRLRGRATAAIRLRATERMGKMRLVVHDKRGYCEKTCGRCVALFPGAQGLRRLRRREPARTGRDRERSMDAVDFEALARDVLRSIGGVVGGKGCRVSSPRERFRADAPRRETRAKRRRRARVDANRVNDTFYESATSTDICASRASRGCSRVDRTFSSPDT